MKQNTLVVFTLEPLSSSWFNPNCFQTASHSSRVHTSKKINYFQTESAYNNYLSNSLATLADGVVNFGKCFLVKNALESSEESRSLKQKELARKKRVSHYLRQRRTKLIRYRTCHD